MVNLLSTKDRKDILKQQKGLFPETNADTIIDENIDSKKTPDFITIDGTAIDITDEEGKQLSKGQIETLKIKALIQKKHKQIQDELNKPLPDGVHEIFKENDHTEEPELIERVVIKNGKRNGICSQFNKGTIFFKGTYINDVLDGPAIEYDEKGKMQAKVFYREGKRDGVMETYEKGKITSTRMYKNDLTNGVQVFYSPQGIIKTKKTEVDGRTHGVCVAYDDVGNIARTCDYVQDERHGFKKAYYPNGNLRRIEEFRDGIKQGKEQMFYPNGALKAEAEYIDDKLVREMVFYDKSGKILERKQKK